MKVINGRGEKVTITETDTGFEVWNHEWAVKIPADTFSEAWDKVEYNVESLCND